MPGRQKLFQFLPSNFRCWIEKKFLSSEQVSLIQNEELDEEMNERGNLGVENPARLELLEEMEKPQKVNVEVKLRGEQVRREEDLRHLQKGPEYIRKQYYAGLQALTEQCNALNAIIDALQPPAKLLRKGPKKILELPVTNPAINKYTKLPPGFVGSITIITLENGEIQVIKETVV